MQNCCIPQRNAARDLKDVLEQLRYETNQTIDQFTPSAWANTHPEALFSLN